MTSFDAYGFYEKLLEQIAQIRPNQNLSCLITEPDGFVSVARIGFDAQHKNVEWDAQCAAFAREVDQGAYGLEALADYEEQAVAVCSFAAFSIGAELAYGLSGELSEMERFHLAAILPAFLLNEAASIASSVTLSVIC